MPTGIEPRNGKFRAWVYDAETKGRITKTHDTLKAAKLWRAEMQAAIGAGRVTADRGPTLAEAVDQWLAGARAGHVRNRSGDPYKPAAIRGYEKDLRLRVLPELGALRIGEIRHKDLQAFVDRLAAETNEDGTAKHSAATIQCAITPLKALFRRALNRGLVAANPTQGLELPAIRSRPRRYASPAEIDMLLPALAGVSRALWATALYAGLRRGELSALRREDVDLATGVIHVRHGWDAVEGEIEPKSRKGKRKVPVPAVLRDVLVEHLMTADGTRVFGPATVRHHDGDATGVLGRLGCPALALHDARHTYASLMIAAGVNAKALSTYMGHANITVTYDLYGHLMPGNEDEAAGLLDAFLARQAGGTVEITEQHGTEVQQ